MLEKILIKNYLSIINEQELKISNRITTLIGGNATGKSTILKAINKLNGEKISDKEKNINHSDAVSSIMAKFRLNKDVINNLNKVYKLKNPNTILELSNNKEMFYYLYLNENGSLSYSLHYAEDDSEIELTECVLPLVIKFVDKKIEEIKNDDLKIKIINGLTNINTIKCLSEEEKNIIGPELIKELGDIISELSNYDDEFLPKYKFVYMNSFKDILIDEIPISSIDSNKTVLNFLKIAGIKKDEIIKYVNEDNQQKIQLLQNKTISVVTDNFRKIFSQVKDDEYFKISMTIDTKNKKLNFWIQNKITQEAVLPFSEESEGMQWYLSLYLKLYEYFNKIDDKDYYILLIDEPNIYLHGEAQDDLLKSVFKEKLFDTQIIYTTHSPYMIDADDLYSIRIIDKEEETKIFNTTIEYLKFKKKEESLNDIDVLSPVLIATGITICNQLTIADDDKIVVVEGPHDYYILSAMNEILGLNDRKLKFIPCQGASKVPFMCGYLYGLGYNVLALLDDDTDGRKAIKELSYQNDDLHFIRAITYAKNNGTKCILEELFSDSDSMQHIQPKSTIKYRNVYDSRHTISFDTETTANFNCVFKQINQAFLGQ